MLTYWDRFMAREFDTIRRRCRKGIPPAVRSRAWQYLCGSRKLIYEKRGIYQV
jgi:TBC1 domain family member 10